MRLIWLSILAVLFSFSTIMLFWFLANQNDALQGVQSWVYERDLQGVIAQALKDEDGDYGVAVKNLTSGEEARYNSDTQSPSASLYKLAVLYAVYKEQAEGKLSFDETLVMTEEDAFWVDDEEPSIPVGGSTTVQEAIYQMITVSDNSSAILLLHRIGADNLNQMMQELGLTQTEIGTQDVALTSPDDIMLLLEKIYRGEGQTPEARQAMIDVLLQQQINDRLPRYLPPGTPVAHKTGELDGVRNDAGIVFTPSGPYIIVVITNNLMDIDHGIEVIAQLSKTVYDYFAALPSPTSAPSDQPQAFRGSQLAAALTDRWAQSQKSESRNRTLHLGHA